MPWPRINQRTFYGAIRGTSDQRLATVIPYAMLQHGIGNPILFIDEAGSLVRGEVDGFKSSQVQDMPPPIRYSAFSSANLGWCALE